MKTKTLILVTGLLVASTRPALSADAINDALQKGLLEEEANHNLDAAIQAYQSVVNQYDDQRKIAATAIFRLGECYRKQGKANEAAAQYQRVLQDFSDQNNLVGLSEKSLASLGRGNSRGESGPISSTVQTVSDPEQLKLLKNEIDLVELEIKTADAKFRNGKGDFADIVKSRKELLSLQRQLPENASGAAQKNLVEQQIKLVEQLLAEVKKQIEVGAAPLLNEIPLKRELLGLQRQLVGISKAPSGARVSTDAESAAASDGEAKEIQRLRAIIKNSPDLLNAKSSSGSTPLHNAVSKGQLEVARFLLENKAQVNAKNNAGSTPLHIAAMNGHKAIVELLLADGADVNLANDAGQTPLHHAAEKGFVEVATVLLAKGTDVNAKDMNNATPLHVAAENGFIAMAKFLIEHKADLNIVRTTQRNAPSTSADILGNGTPLHIAARGQQELAGLLLESGAQVDPKDTFGWTPLHVAAKYRQWRIILSLLEKKADVNARGDQGRSALQLCVANRDLYTANLLLQRGADVNNQAEDSSTPLGAAVLGASPEMVELLLAHKPNLELRNSDGFTPLQEASRRHLWKLTELLLKSGADPNARMASDQNRTILHWAVSFLSNPRSDKQLFDIILTSKATDVNARDETGRTALHLAVAAGWTEPAELLLSRGADVNARTAEGYTALHSAAAKNNVKTVELLLKNKAEVNAQDEAGNTPLHYSATSNAKETVALLLKSKADVNVVNKDGATPLKMANGGGGFLQYDDLGIPTKAHVGGPVAVPVAVVRGRSPEVVSLLRQHGAKE